MSILSISAAAQKIIAINVGALSLAASVGIHYVSNESAVSQIETSQSAAFGVSLIGSTPQQDTSEKDEKYAGFAAFSKLFAKEEVEAGISDNSLLGPKGDYDEVFIGKRFE